MLLPGECRLFGGRQGHQCRELHAAALRSLRRPLERATGTPEALKTRQAARTDFQGVRSHARTCVFEDMCAAARALLPAGQH